MARRPLQRARDIKERITAIRSMLAGKSLEQMRSDPLIRAAFERYMEVISEASRTIPSEWKAEYGREIPWPKIAAIGNILRHAYHDTDPVLLWSIYENDLEVLERAIDAMLAANGPI